MCDFFNPNLGLNVIPVNQRAVPFKKRKRVSLELAERQDNLLALRNYDDGSKECVKFFTNVVGTGKIIRYIFPEEYNIPEVVDIEFPYWNKVIAVPCPVNGRKLYRALCDEGICFNREMLSETEIVHLLEQYYMPKIKNAPREMANALCGWNCGKYATGKTLEFYGNDAKTLFPTLPRLNKYLYEDNVTVSDMQEYIHILNMVKNTELRLLLLVHPMAAMLSSISERAAPVINFIVEGKIRYALAYMTQVFERYKPIIHTTSQTQKEIDKILSRVRDETVVFSADFERHMSAYEQNKMERNVDEVIDVVSGMKILPAPYMRKVTAGGSIFSNYEISDKRVITEYVDDEDFEEAFMNYASWENNDIPGKVFAAFVMYVEENIQEVTKYLQATKSEEPLQIYCVVIKFLVDLFEKYDISMLKELHLENYISIVSHLNKNQENGDITETFREIMRKEIQKIMTAEKGEVTRVDQQMVYYNDEFIWIPSELLKQILRKRNILPMRKKLLVKLRERKVLVTDVGFTRKLMVANQRFETLQIKRGFFTKIGEADIVELGKEYNDGF